MNDPTWLPLIYVGMTVIGFLTLLIVSVFTMIGELRKIRRAIEHIGLGG